MPIDPNGSKPEVMNPGGGEFIAQNYTAREIEHLPGKPNNWRPKKKVGLPDDASLREAYRAGWDRIFGKKEESPSE